MKWFFQKQNKKAKESLPDGWSGNYANWQQAAASCGGYDKPEILEKCKASLLKIKNGEAIYERDSVLFDEIQYSWGLLACLERAALDNNGQLCVLDFGGSLGSSYFQNKAFLGILKGMKWCIVEQENFVDCGKENFENEELLFYNTIEACITEQQPNVLLLSGVLQYLEKPYEWIEKFIALGIPYIILDRTAFIEAEQDILTVQAVPENIYKASYPAWFFGKNFLNPFLKKYKMIAPFDSGFTDAAILNGTDKVYWGGIILKK